MADETEPAMFDALEKALMPLNSARQLAELSGIGESTLPNGAERTRDPPT